MGVTLERCAFAGVSPHEAFAYCMELVPVCLCVLAPANLCPCEIWSLCEVGVRRCTRLVHRATVLLRVSTVVAFCAALIGGGAVGAKAEITASVPAGVHWRASPEGMPLWGPNRFWPGSGLVQVSRCLGPGECLHSFIHSLRRACLQPVTNTQNSKPRPPTTNARSKEN